MNRVYVVLAREGAKARLRVFRENELIVDEDLEAGNASTLLADLALYVAELMQAKNLS